MAKRLSKFGLSEISIKRIQGRFFLIEGPDDEFMEVLKQNDWAYLKECFINIKPWSKKRYVFERVAWIDIPEEEEGDTPEVELGTRTESKQISEVSRNEVRGALNAINLEEGEIENNGMGLSIEGILSEENIIRNKEIISVEDVENDREMVRAEEDMLNIGLLIQVDPKEGRVQQKGVDLGVGYTVEDRQFLRSDHSLNTIEEGYICFKGRSFEEAELYGTYKSLWLIAIVASYWSIWLARNEMVFERKVLLMYMLIFHSKMKILLWVRAAFDECMVQERLWWFCLYKCRFSKSGPWGWSYPPKGWLKFNVSSIVSEVALGGSGGVLRDEEEIVRALFSGPSDACYADSAELGEIVTALDVFIEIG
ncbi:hypothetical protein J1N35_001856 [Gossypium stocksii]|uniref:DUF4283 domain-containing protein n=1 Tax=Gossypium stocksii TaxID=47602 RepID=A0A9D3WKP0_9ROSI|nr:hypothetical protein J1N35_001856 [Gossypium stocksii]